MWVFYTQRPLFMKELKYAVSTECLQTNPIFPIYNVETIFEFCSNLLVEADNYLWPIHYSVQEFLTSSSQREINYIYADHIIATDPTKMGFTNLFQNKLDHICKNICIEKDSSKAKIALAYLTYFTTNDTLFELCKALPEVCICEW